MKRHSKGVALFVVALLIAALLFVPSFPAICPVRRVLHVPCPSCGLVRSFRLWCAGDFGEALQLHPLLPLVFFASLVIGAEQAIAFRKGQVVPAPLGRPGKMIATMTLVLLCVLWVLRFFGLFGGPVNV